MIASTPMLPTTIVVPQSFQPGAFWEKPLWAWSEFNPINLPGRQTHSLRKVN